MEQWIVDLIDEVQTPSTAKSIFRVPKFFSNFDPQAYKPMLASFGPYHHGCQDLQHMEQHKHCALIQFLRRISKASKTAKDVVEAMKQVKASLLSSYDSLDSTTKDNESCGCGSHSRWDNLPEDAFLQMIITDGCFALEVMLVEARSKTGESSKNGLTYDRHDPVFGTMRNKYIAPYLARDMLLLENQLPFIALTTLADFQGSGVGDVSALVKGFYNIHSASSKSLIDEDRKAPSVEIFHILDLLRQTLRDGVDYLPGDDVDEHSDKKLKKAGDISKKESFIVINLNGIDLPLPIIGMNEVIESMLLNVIVFDSLYVSTDDKMTPADNEVTPADDEVTPADDEVTPADAEVTPADDEVTPADDEVTPADAEVTPADDEVTPADDEVTTADAEVTPNEPQGPQHIAASRGAIYRIPKIFTVNNRKAYEPRVASFGPYHYGRPHLRYMEKHKRSAHTRYLSRIRKASKTQDDVLNAMRNVESLLLSSYDNLHNEDYNEERFERGRFLRHDLLEGEFLNLMIVDGCFALEVMLAEAIEGPTFEREDDTDNPVFITKKAKYLVPHLVRDMLLLENQLPFLALTTLANIEGSGIENVVDLIIAFYKLSSASTDNKITSNSRWMEQANNTAAVVAWVGRTLGVMDYQRQDFFDRELSLRRIRKELRHIHILALYKEIRTVGGTYRLTKVENMHSATKLKNAGVSFRCSKSDSFRDITFKGGVLSLPRLEIDNSTELVLLNLIAFEQLHPTVTKSVTAYAVLMDSLIDTEDDVNLLKTNKIINGSRGCDQDIAHMFNKITKGFEYRYDTVGRKDVNVNEDLHNYHQSTINNWWASFKELYLKNLWAFLALLGGLFLLTLTVAQTAYTILPYYHAKLH